MKKMNLRKNEEHYKFRSMNRKLRQQVQSNNLSHNKSVEYNRPLREGEPTLFSEYFLYWEVTADNGGLFVSRTTGID